MIKLETSFETKDGKWILCPNNNVVPPYSFEGSPIASKKVTKLIGDFGINKIKEIIDTVTEVRRLITGSRDIPCHFYFLLNIDEIVNHREDHVVNENNLSQIFREKIFIICSQFDIGEAIDEESGKTILKNENWDWEKYEKDEIAHFEDFYIHLPSDVHDNPYESADYEWDYIKKGDPKKIERMFYPTVY